MPPTFLQRLFRSSEAEAGEAKDTTPLPVEPEAMPAEADSSTGVATVSPSHPVDENPIPTSAPPATAAPPPATAAPPPATPAVAGPVKRKQMSVVAKPAADKRELAKPAVKPVAVTTAATTAAQLSPHADAAYKMTLAIYKNKDPNFNAAQLCLRCKVVGCRGVQYCVFDSNVFIAKR